MVTSQNTITVYVYFFNIMNRCSGNEYQLKPTEKLRDIKEIFTFKRARKREEKSQGDNSIKVMHSDKGKNLPN